MQTLKNALLQFQRLEAKYEDVETIKKNNYNSLKEDAEKL